MFLFAASSFRHTLWHILRRLGGPGLILLGVVDNSFVPVPGSMDAFTLLLAASHKDLWWYYALMATAGGVLGGYLTYRIGVRGGKEALEKRISAQRAKKFYHAFERYGFWYIAFGAICPPPMPITPFLLAPGALNYPRQKFLAALALGRSIRYGILAYLGSIYGRTVLKLLFRYYKPLLYLLIALAIMGAIAALWYWRRHKAKTPGTETAEPLRKTA